MFSINSTVFMIFDGEVEEGEVEDRTWESGGYVLSIRFPARPDLWRRFKWWKESDCFASKEEAEKALNQKEKEISSCLEEIELPDDLDIYSLKHDAMGLMYDYNSAVLKPNGIVEIDGANIKSLAAVTVLYRCLGNATSVSTMDLNQELLDELEEKESKYPRVTKLAVQYLKELLENY